MIDHCRLQAPGKPGDRLSHAISAQKGDVTGPDRPAPKQFSGERGYSSQASTSEVYL